MELIQIDPLQPQALQAALDRAPQMLGTTVLDPGATIWSQKTALGGNNQARWIGMQRLRDQQLVCFRAVAICRVDEIHAKLDRAPQNPTGVISISWHSPG